MQTLEPTFNSVAIEYHHERSHRAPSRHLQLVDAPESPKNSKSISNVSVVRSTQDSGFSGVHAILVTAENYYSMPWSSSTMLMLGSAGLIYMSWAGFPVKVLPFKCVTNSQFCNLQFKSFSRRRMDVW